MMVREQIPPVCATSRSRRSQIDKLEDTMKQINRPCGRVRELNVA